MEKGFVDVNGIRTKVVTFGPSIYISDHHQPPFNKKRNATQIDDVFLVIPGNPGISTFYLPFMRALYDKCHWPVWIIGHGGHERDPLNDSSFLFGSPEEQIGLRSQIEHKIKFIQMFIPETTTIHLIGHSIGGYIALEMLKDSKVQDRIHDVKLLFPTIEHMADTRYGRSLNAIRPFANALVFLTWFFTILPRCLQLSLLYVFQYVADIPLCHQKSMVQLLNPWAIKQILHMAYEELDSIHDRDNATIAANLWRILFVYGRRDQWTPQPFWTVLKSEHANADVRIVDHDHAFVLRHSFQVADLVANVQKRQSQCFSSL